MEESRIRELVLDAIANVTVATCTTGRLQTPLDFVTITKVGIGMVAIMGSVYALYWNLRWICIATTDRPPIQQDGSMSPKEMGYTTHQTPRQHSDLKQNSNLWGLVLLLTALDLLSVLGPDQDPSCVCTWTFKHTDSSFL